MGLVRIAILSLAVTAVLVRPAPAQDNTKDTDDTNSTKSEAYEKFRAGAEAFDRGRFAEARRNYLRSYELSPRPRTLFNLAVCEEKLGLKEEAYEHYTSFAAIAENRDAELKRRAAASLALLSNELAATVQVDSRPSQADVYVDGASTPAGKTPLKLRLPPGSHSLRLTRGAWSASETISVRPRKDDRRVVELTSAPGVLLASTDVGGGILSIDGIVKGTIPPDGSLKQDIPAGDRLITVERNGYPAWRDQVTVGPGQTLSLEVRFKSERSRGARIALWSLTGGGVASVAVGGALGVFALKDKDDGSDKRALIRAVTADGLVVVGIASLVAAGIVYFKSAPDGPEATVEARSGSTSRPGESRASSAKSAVE